MDTKQILWAGILLLALELCWLLSDSDHGAVKVYNLKEENRYRYLGILWIRKKQGDYCLKIPPKMVAASLTTEYKLRSVSSFHKEKRGQKLQIIFAGGYETTTLLKEEMQVKNYIATSGQL